MKTSRILMLAAAAGLAAVLTGCATNASQPGASTGNTAAPSPDSTAVIPDGWPEIQAVWLNADSIVITAPGDGCRPTLTDVVVGDGTLDVTIEKLSADATCTEPLLTYGYLLVAPAGIDTSQPLTLNITNWMGDAKTITLDGNPAGGPVPADKMMTPAPAAVWVNDTDIAVLTYGSSSCAPMSGTFSGAGDSLTLTLAEPDTMMCTMDYAPRITIVSAPDIAKDATFTLAGFTDENEAEIVLQLAG